MHNLSKVIAGILAVLLIVCLLMLANKILPRYTRRALVVDISGSRVTCRENNREWQFYDDARDYGLYEYINLDMDDNHTEHDCTDDYIIRANGHAVQRMQCYAG